MNIRRVLVPLEGSERDRPALSAALAVATAFDAHVDAMYVRLQPSDTLPFVGEGMSAALVQEMIELTERESAQHAVAAEATFEELRQAVGVPQRSEPGQPGPSADWFEEDALVEDAIVTAGRLADLIVLARPAASGGGSGNATFGITLFETGRPVLVAGTHGPLTIAGKVVVAWDGSAQATRALTAALPFLARAARVTLVTARESGSGEGELADVAAYLAWHGISAERRAVMHHPSVAEALVAAAIGADLLVMGGYSHSRLRELILGGVTRHMLEKAAVPLLLAH